MNILILSSSNPYRAAGIVALDIFQGLRKIEGNNVRMVVKVWDNYIDKDIIPMQSHINHLKSRIIAKLRKILRINNVSEAHKYIKNYDYCIQDYDQTISYYSTEKILKKTRFNPDIIIILFAQNFLSYKDICELNLRTKAPIIQYLMDMAPFTGGCHYAWDCRGYTKECGECPGLDSHNSKDQTNKNWIFKKENIIKTDLIIVAASEWQWRQINESSLFETKEKVKILSPTNSELFCPHNKSDARGKLKIPVDKRIILLGALNPYERRKGYCETTSSLKILYNKLSKEQQENILILVAGETNEDFKKEIHFDVHLLGYLSHNMLALAYQAADIFLNTSIEDSGPTMINQSIMSGTPVVAYEMGVAPDLVRTGVTGYMAKLRDSNDLSNGIINILNLTENEYNKMSINCRELGIKTCSHIKVLEDLWKLIKYK